MTGYKNLGDKHAKKISGGTSFYPIDGLAPVFDHYREKDAKRYGRGEAESVAFDRAAEDVKHPEKAVRSELKNILGKEHKHVKLNHTGFIGHDSGNVVHANAFHGFNAVGPTRLVQKIKSYYEG